jgi:WD repeat and FYVE domain-containing protein 3
LAKSGSESSISEACDSVKESKKQFEDEKEECSDKDEPQTSKNQLTIDNKTSMSSAKSITQLKEASDGVVRRGRRESKLRSVSHIEQTVDDSDGFEDVTGPPEKGIRPSKSDTSLTESFVMIDNDGGGRRMSYKQNILRDGEWKES